ncbi:MAG: (d)CMP kinase [Trueperaceae bacterium]|nr:MAG: (d)CMP kinase [Trueperaceae bacterium]
MIVSVLPDQIIITLDGPAASGKSSAGKGVAKALGIPFVSSGLLYRAATYLMSHYGVAFHDDQALLQLLYTHRVELILQVNDNRVLIDGKDITDLLHSDEIDHTVSTVAAHNSLREWVGERLQELHGPFVIEGRDMGTAVFPQAAYKFYLTAPVEIRARRRFDEREADLEAVATSLRRRDRLDAKQLTPAKDAICIDTTNQTLAQTIEQILAYVHAARSP